MLKDGKPVGLTKEEAIRLHREMWNDMAKAEKKLIEQCGSNLGFDRSSFKEIWVTTHGFADVYANCFLCEYDCQYDNDCTECPINWGGIDEESKEVRTCMDNPVDEHGNSIDFGFFNEKKIYFKSHYNQIHWKFSPIEKVANAPLKELR